MAVGLLEVDAAPAIIAVDLASAMLGGVGPVFEAAAADARKDLIKIFFADKEGVVLNADVAILLIKIQRYAVSSSTTRNGPKGFAGGSPRISVRNPADFCLLRHQTMVWLSCTLMHDAPD